MYLRYHHSKRVAGVMVGCTGPTWHGPALQLDALSYQAEFVAGRVRADVTAVVLRFADGERATIEPTEGFVLYTVPREHLAPSRRLVAAAARNAAGKTVATQEFPAPPSRRARSG